MKKLGYLLAVVGGAFGLLGCSGGGQANLGDGQVGVTGEKLSDYAGKWDGYVEAFDFGNGSDRLRVELDAQGHGVLRVGNSPDAPVPAEPVLRYPDLDYQITAELQPALQYPILDGEATAGRITFSVDPNAPYANYCPLFTPVDVSTTGAWPPWSCSMDWSSTCCQHCVCDSTACSVTSVSTIVSEFGPFGVLRAA